MAGKKEETASFVLRFNQKIFKNDTGESEVQWRGNIRHVQGGDEKRFSEFDEVVKFIQAKLADLTILAMEDKTPEEQKGILAKSFDIWKRMALDAPKIVMETIKDPKKQVTQIQELIQEQLHQVKDDIEEKLEINSWRGPSKSDFSSLMETLEVLSGEVTKLNKKVDKLSKKKS